MLTQIGDLPPNVLGIEATGQITHEDYQKVLIPKAEAMMAKGPLRILYVLGKEFSGYDVGALWDDGAFGIKHWHDFSRVAVVCDQTSLRTAVNLFKPFFPCEVRLFSVSDLQNAKTWLIGADS
jgi:hypothetical protein